MRIPFALLLRDARRAKQVSLRKDFNLVSNLGTRTSSLDQTSRIVPKADVFSFAVLSAANEKSTISAILAS
jgi:hypothetical protein